MENVCASCGAANATEMRFCQTCGKPLGGTETRPEKLKSVRVKEGKWRTVNTWAYLVAGANGKDGMLTEKIRENLAAFAVPDIVMEHRNVKHGGWFSASHRQLVIENQKMVGYHFFISVEDYGKQLNVSWYLMVRRNLITSIVQLSLLSPWVWLFLFWLIPFAKLWYRMRGLTVPELMNSFEIEELTAFTTTAHHAVLDAVENLMKGMNMNFAKVDTKSRGFLNIS